MLVVIAIGGKALLGPGTGLEADAHRAGARSAVAAIAEVARHHQVVVTHGSAPQVGLLAYQSALSREVTEYPLDIVEAEAQGFLGYLLQQELQNELRDRNVATMLTQVQVDPETPGFDRRRKLVGPVLAPVDADRMRRDRGWEFEATGRGFRRSVPSPEPLAIVELETIRLLASAGALVVCAGGGGIPVRCDADGALHGVEAVIDKDRSAALLASLLGADLLLYLTDVPAVSHDWGSAFARPIERISPAELALHHFDEATIGPKVQSACRFVRLTGKRAAIGAVTDAEAVCAGRAGTQVVAEEFDPAVLSGVPGAGAR
ncbi:MAG TPA: carbamate kinase [Acidimicrobiia bacterium]|nr:carbamate kinase [Acidimicrobiia bacterium]